VREINVICRRVGLLVCLLPAPQFRKATFYIYSSALDKGVLIYFELCNVGAPLCLSRLQYKCSRFILLRRSFNPREA
jgi:hypothetical protein